MGDVLSNDRWFTPSTLVDLVKVLAILVAAGWSVYLFVRFESSERDLSLQLLRAQNLQSELTLQLSRVRIEKEELAVAQTASTRLELSQEIEITDLGPAGEDGRRRFLVSHNYSIRNAGVVRAEITYLVVQAFSAALPMPDDNTAIEITSVKDEEGLAWVWLFSKGYYYAPEWTESKRFANGGGQKVGFRKGGGGTAELDSSESSRGSVTLVVVARPTDLVGFETRIGIDGGTTADNRWRLENKTHLEETEPVG